MVVNNRDLELEKTTATNPASYNNSYNNNGYNNNSGFYNTGIVGGKSNANYFDDFPKLDKNSCTNILIMGYWRGNNRKGKGIAPLWRIPYDH